MAMVVGRLAPSPTGAQHVGNARTFLLAWLSARSQNGQVIFRIEDIDSPRVKGWAAQQAMDDLRWLGLDWDQGPDAGGPHEPYTQTQRLSRYQIALQQLKQAEAVYPCTCSRTDVEAAASAPHAGQEGPAYPGTCSGRYVSDADQLSDRPFAWRFRINTAEIPEELSFDDVIRGRQSGRLSETGDFVIARGEGIPAYQLAVVVDDHAMGVTEVVRGDDLVASTFRQLALYQFFGWTPPRFAHVPLVVGPDGRRLAKRHGDTRISVLREQGVPPERLIGLLAYTCGLIDRAEPIAAKELIRGFRWSELPRESLVFTAADWSTLTA